MSEKKELNIGNSIKIKNIVLFNSASYGYFQTSFDKNLVLEGNNNSGKTSILNILQLLFLPEDNLKNFNSKFAMSSGHNKKSYTGKDTYKYYFPNENSYCLVEIENKNTIFCVLLYGFSLSNLSFRRHIFETSFKEIKHLFIENDVQNTISKEQLITKLKKISTDDLLIKTKNEVKEHLYSIHSKNTKDFKYNIVPLKDTKESTIAHFSLLFKSIYNISNLNKENTKKLIGDIITTRYAEKGKNFNFNVEETIGKFKLLKLRKKKFETLKRYEEEYNYIFDKSKTLQEDFEMLENHLALIWKRGKEEESQIIDVSGSLARKKEELNNKKIALQNEIELKEKEKNDIMVNIATYGKEEQSVVETFTEMLSFFKTIEVVNFFTDNGISKDILSDSSLIRENIDNLTKCLNKYFDLKNKILASNEDKYKQIFNALNNGKHILKEIESAKLELEVLKEERTNLNEILNTPSLLETNEFNDDEKVILDIVFKEEFLRNQVFKFSEKSISDIKSFLNEFKIEGNYVVNDQVKISISNSKALSVDFNKRKVELDDLISKKEEILTALEKRLYLDEGDILTELEKDISLLKKETNLILKQLNNVTNILELEEKHDKLQKKGVYLKNELNRLKVDINDLKNNLSTTDEEYYDVKKQNDTVWGEHEQLKKYLRMIEGSDFTDVFFDNRGIRELKISDDSLIGSLFDIGDEVELFRKNKELYLYEKNKVNENMGIFISLGIFEDDVEIEHTIHYINDDSSFNTLLTVLNSFFNTINEEEENLSNDIMTLSEDTMNAVLLLKEAIKDIADFEKNINENFTTLTISDLSGIKFEISLQKDLISQINKLQNSIKLDNFDFLEQIVAVNNYLLTHTNTGGTIKIDSLIDDIEYKTQSIDDEGNIVYTTNTQSNGTETMITLIFLSFLFDEIYKDGYKLNIPIPVDEIGKIDIENIKTLLSVMENRDFVLVGATPLATPEFRNVFNKIVTIDQVVLEDSLDSKRKLYVTEDSILNNFTLLDNND